MKRRLSRARSACCCCTAAFQVEGYYRSLLTVVLVSYSKIVTFGVRWLDCKTLSTAAGSYSVVRAEPDVHCDEAGYPALQAYAILLVVWGALLPSALYATLRFFARDGTLFKPDFDRFGFSLLFKPFKQTHYYWTVSTRARQKLSPPCL